MPELPEVEILVRYLAPLLTGRTVREVQVFRPRLLRPDRPEDFRSALRSATLRGVRRRAKFLLFDLEPRRGTNRTLLVGHLGMTGRMFLQAPRSPLPDHTAVALDLGDAVWVFQDPRGFGRLTFDASSLNALGPEPLEAAFTPASLGASLARSRQPAKVKLLDQRVVAGVGNIYASEALHRAGISPRRAAGRLRQPEIARLHAALRETLADAIRFGSTLSPSFDGRDGGGRLFYYGAASGTPEPPPERLRVYDRDGRPCLACSEPIRRIVQAGRSTYFCPRCQR